MKHLIYANQINNHKLEIRKKLCDANEIEKMLIPPFFSSHILVIFIQHRVIYLRMLE